MITFKPITEDLLEIVLEIINSNSSYNILENGNSFRSIEEVKREFLNQDTESYIVIFENKYVGIIDFLKNNPKDNCPWIGLFMIHEAYHSMGYGKKVYDYFEEKLKQQNYKKIRIGILQKNIVGKKFWTSLGFKFYKISPWQKNLVECFEKLLI